MRMQLSDVSTYYKDGKYGAIYGLDPQGTKQRVSAAQEALGQFQKGGSYLIDVDPVHKGDRTFYNFLRIVNNGVDTSSGSGESEAAKYERLAREAREKEARQKQQAETKQQDELPPILSNVLAHAVGNGVKAEELPDYGIYLARAIRAFRAEQAVPGGGKLEPESMREVGPGEGPEPPPRTSADLDDDIPFA